MSITSNVTFRKRHTVIILTCAVVLCLIIVTSYTQAVKFGTFYELIKPANILGYIKLLLYLRCLKIIRSEDAQTKNAMFVILFTWFMGDLIDAVDGPIARYTGTDSSFGEKLDHRVFDVFRDPFVWVVLTTIYPEFMAFWQVLLFRMFIKEDEKFQIPRVPILPFINVAWYFPVIVVFRYLNIQNTTITKVIQVYLACVFLTWGLEGDPPLNIRLDWYTQCYLLGQSDRCKDLTKVDNKTT